MEEKDGTKAIVSPPAKKQSTREALSWKKEEHPPSLSIGKEAKTSFVSSTGSGNGAKFLLWKCRNVIAFATTVIAPTTPATFVAFSRSTIGAIAPVAQFPVHLNLPPLENPIQPKEILSEISTPPRSTLIHSILELPSHPLLPRAISSLQLHLAHNDAKAAARFSTSPPHSANSASAQHTMQLPRLIRSCLRHNAKLPTTRPELPICDKRHGTRAEKRQ